MGMPAGSFRQIGRPIQSGYFRQLDIIRYDRGRRSGTPQDAPGHGSSLPDPGLSGSPHTVPHWGWNITVFNGPGAPSRVCHGPWTDGPGTAFLLLLEKTEGRKIASAIWY